ncbi:phosphatase PAP2 family protein [Aliidiomarina shirensis]|uniref:undecaprenyl-diphosphate phosphatase n=1 Tax=Aliidiomarina shirensis TaxID=1048642 RepID=A0A432WNU1_9GAMM|nr:phosphatase PAP2 family protein [Aliidiomarina shirensis]RUO35470.1 phosphatase PAP2 family protein [Aliidiomarina shirensis]
MKWLMQLPLQLQRVDEISFFWLSRQLRRPSGGSLARWISKSGDGYGYLIFCLLAFAVGDADAGTLLALLLLAFLIELPVYWLLKNTLRRTRPYERSAQFTSLIKASDKFSFPSGHTTAAFMFASLCATLMPSLTLIVFAWASLIGLSRIALGVHYPTDILAGAALGTGLASLTLVMASGWLM